MAAGDRTLYVAGGNNTIIPVDVAANRAGAPIRAAGLFAQADPVAIAITPDGRTLYAASQGNNTIAEISLAR